VIGPTAPLDIGVTPSSAQISLGDSADFTLSLSSDGSLNEPVTLSCGNLPRGTRCVFDRRQIETKDLPATVKLTILTAALHSAVHGGRRDVGMVAGLFIIFGTAWMGLMLGIVTGRRRKIYGVMMLLGIAALVAVIGCQGVITPDNRGSFTATVTSKSGKVQQTTNIELTLK
jgi:hypothetical protein